MTAPLRYCLITSFYPPHNFGGDGVAVQRFARALAARGHRVTVVYEVDGYRWLAGAESPQATAAHDPIEVIRLRSRLGVLSTFLTHQSGRPISHRRQLARLFRERSFDVVMFHNVSLVGGPGLFSFGGDALRLYLAHEHWLVCPTHVLWRHNREICTGFQCLRCTLHYRRPPQAWRYTGYLERQLRHIDAFVARSDFSRDKHRELGFPRDMEVLPDFVPAALMEQAVESEPGSPHPRPYFLFVGRLERNKGLATILPVFSRRVGADLLVVGDGREAAALKAQAAGNPRVRFVGHVQNEELGRYYRHAIALLVPSVSFETFGIVLIEAFCHRTPVIARRIGPFPEMIEQSGGGELFATEEELIGAMDRLQQDPRHRAELGRRAHRACVERWSEEVVMARHREIVARAARDRARRRGVAPPPWCG